MRSGSLKKVGEGEGGECAFVPDARTREGGSPAGATCAATRGDASGSVGSYNTIVTCKHNSSSKIQQS